MYGTSTTSQRVAHYDNKGFTLIEILIAIVLIGILSAVAVVGISNLVSKGGTSACQASADSAKAGSAVYFASNNRYPTNFLELTAAGTNGAPMTLPSGVTPSPILNTTVRGVVRHCMDTDDDARIPWRCADIRLWLS